MKFIPKSFLIASFNFRKIRCLLKICIAINPKNYRVTKFCLKCLFYVSFCFCTSVFRLILKIIYNEPNILVILDFALKAWIFLRFLSSLERQLFAYCKLIYFSISRTDSSIEGDEGYIFSIVPNWKYLFLLKLKTKKNRLLKKDI